ncbi:folate family ECF transporter S component [Clostridium fermenticellae]|uniref:Folate family ECF transporter S component n=1 Tax=Clostridium fermenticellae TaxID=2068654 RepID=A0A386H3V9_9CLOT|nr:folate family ECF transporter S component [Clostridium fermenticellae]AYD40334.1 folate family ECF transporter S component [Clostridium fermenticellae]
MKNKLNTKSLVMTALFIAISLCVRTISINIIAAGTLTMRISFAAIFYVLPGFLFGPIYGAIAGGIVDVLGYIITPMGPYIPLMTITNIIAGAVPALIFKNIKDINLKSIKKYYTVFFVLILLVGMINFLSIKLMPFSILSKQLFKFGNKAQYFGIGFIMISFIGLFILMMTVIIGRRLGKTCNFINRRYFKFAISIGVSGLIVSTLNTFILLIFTPSLMANGFLVLWIPRIVQTIFLTFINSYIISILVYYYETFEKRLIEDI